MSPDKDSALCTKYPKIFRDRNASPQETCMCWGFDVGDGWYDLIDTLCGCIQHHVDWKIKQQKFKLESGDIKPEDAIPEEDLQVVAVQVKEKFGGLRIYFNGTSEEVLGMIGMAESMSYRICENCGCPARPNKSGWITTLCASCRSEHEAKQAEARAAWEKDKK